MRARTSFGSNNQSMRRGRQGKGADRPAEQSARRMSGCQCLWRVHGCREREVERVGATSSARAGVRLSSQSRERMRGSHKRKNPRTTRLNGLNAHRLTETRLQVRGDAATGADARRRCRLRSGKRNAFVALALLRQHQRALTLPTQLAGPRHQS